MLAPATYCTRPARCRHRQQARVMQVTSCALSTMQWASHEGDEAQRCRPCMRMSQSCFERYWSQCTRGATHHQSWQGRAGM